MKSINRSNRKLIIAIFTFVLVFGFTSTALAYEYDQPNYGDPITVDGDTSDWDLSPVPTDSMDHFSVMYRDADTNLVIEADAYLRYNHTLDTLYILILSRNGQNVRTINGQIVDLNTNIRVIQSPYLDPTNPQEFAWVNLNSGETLAEGWEAAVDLGVQPPIYQIFIHSLLEGNQKAWIDLPINFFRLDYGDLPDTYGTYEASSGPKHSAGRLRLGRQVDGESDGQPGTNPILDDINGRNDEDGVLAIGNWRFGTPTFEYTVNGCTGTCFLNAWVDWGNDGGFGTGDTLFTNLPVTNGTFTHSFPLPEDIEFPSTFNTRFRLCESDEVSGQTCATPLAISAVDAPFGEVEDYQWSFDPNAVSLNSFTATPRQNSTLIYILTGSVAAILLLGTATFVQKRKNQ